MVKNAPTMNREELLESGAVAIGEQRQKESGGQMTLPIDNNTKVIQHDDEGSDHRQCPTVYTEPIDSRCKKAVSQEIDLQTELLATADRNVNREMTS